MAVGFVAAQIIHKFARNHNRKLVGFVVVVPVRNIAAFALKIHGKAVFVSDNLYFRVFNCGKRVGNDCQARNTGRLNALDIRIVQRQFKRLVRIFVVHIVNDFKRVHVHAGKPFHHLLKALHNFAVVKIFGRDRLKCRRNLRTRFFVASAVDGVEQTLGQVGACAEKLHLLSDFHRRNAARDAVVVAEFGAHQIVVFVLNRRGFD